MLQGRLARGEGRGGVVAHDIVKLGMLDSARHAHEMIKPLVALGVRGSVARGKHGVYLARDEGGVYHGVLRVAGVDVEARDVPVRGGGIERLKIHFLKRAAVNGIGKVRAEAVKVQQRRPVTDLLIRREAHGDAPVGYALRDDALTRGHDLRHARLVVRAEDGGAVGGDERLPLERRQLRELLRREDAPARAEGHFPAVIVFYDLRADVLARKVRHGVYMRDEPYRPLALHPGARGERGIHIGVLVLIDLRHAKRAQLIREQVRKVELARGRRRRVDILRARGVHRGVLQKSFICSHHVKNSPCVTLIYIVCYSTGRKKSTAPCRAAYRFT